VDQAAMNASIGAFWVGELARTSRSTLGLKHSMLYLHPHLNSFFNRWKDSN